jgi:pilus assembly protein CpaF
MSSLMKRVSERGSTSQDENVAQHVASEGSSTSRRAAAMQETNLYSVLQHIQTRMMRELDGTLNVKDVASMRRTIDELLTCILEEEGMFLARGARKDIFEMVVNEILGFGPLEELLSDESTTDIMVIGPDRVYVERKGRLHPTKVHFRDNDHLMRIIDRMLAPLGRKVDEMTPTCDARLPDGSRVNVVVPPVALDGAALTIRKFAVTPLQVSDLIEFGTATEEVFEFLYGGVMAGLNMIVAGGSSSGKTTLLNVLSGFLPANERIVTMENAAELQLRQPHVVRLESRPPNMEQQGEITIRDLVINSLRMRPDRIVVGEVRSGEAIDLLQAMNTGHDGSMGTLHANSPHDALSRIETMVLSAGMDLPIRAIREQMASAIHLIVHMGRDHSGIRRILSIAEVSGMEVDTISLSEIFRFEKVPGSEGGELVATGLVPRCIDKINDAGVRLSAALFQSPSWTISGNIRTMESSPSKPQREETPPVSYATAPEERVPRYQTPQPEVPYSPPPSRADIPYPTPATALMQPVDEFTFPPYEPDSVTGRPQDFAESDTPPFDDAFPPLTDEEIAAMQATEVPDNVSPKLTGLLSRLPASRGAEDHTVA